MQICLMAFLLMGYIQLYGLHTLQAIEHRYTHICTTENELLGFEFITGG